MKSADKCPSFTVISLSADGDVQVQKTDCFVLIYRQNNGRSFFIIIYRKKF